MVLVPKYESQKMSSEEKVRRCCLVSYSFFLFGPSRYKGRTSINKDRKLRSYNENGRFCDAPPAQRQRIGLLASSQAVELNLQNFQKEPPNLHHSRTNVKNDLKS